MRIILNNKNNPAPIARAGRASANFLDNRIGFWGDVAAVNSQNNTVDVTADIGLTYRNIPVMSREWVNASDAKDYVTAERNLPPVGARVFVLTPTRTVTGGFVLCSGFAKGEEDTHTLYAASDEEQEDKNSVRERVTQGGWNETEDYANGNFAAKSQDGNITFSVNTAENSEKEQKKEVSLVAWSNEIHITEQGISVTIPANANLTVSIEGKQEQTVNGDYTLSAGGNLKFVSSKQGTLEVGNSEATLGKMISDLLDYLASLKTVGSPVNHSASPDFINNINTLKTKWEGVFK